MSAFSHALVIDGQLVSADKSEPLVPWWSFSKTVLAATALTLVRDGLVSLDEVMPGGPFTPVSYTHLTLPTTPYV